MATTGEPIWPRNLRALYREERRIMADMHEANHVRSVASRRICELMVELSVVREQQQEAAGLVECAGLPVTGRN